jgi:hypothetical protein
MEIGLLVLEGITLAVALAATRERLSNTYQKRIIELTSKIGCRRILDGRMERTLTHYCALLVIANLVDK